MRDPKSMDAQLYAQYNRKGLIETVFQALERAGKMISDYRDTAAFDEFHMRGNQATRELATLAGLSKGQVVLDLGCGLGGPDRIMAAEYGCRVVGVDLIPEFVRMATLLSQKVGLTDQTGFQVCNMSALPFKGDSFDVVWSQHTLMNIEDKGNLFQQIHHVLKPGGICVLYEILAGAVTSVHFPVQWADNAAISFLLEEQAFKKALLSAGFELKAWQEKTAECLDWFKTLTAKMAGRAKAAAPPIGLNLVIGPTAAEKAHNTMRNLAEDRIRVVYAIFQKQRGE